MKKRDFERRKEDLRQIWLKEKETLDLLRLNKETKKQQLLEQGRLVKSNYDTYQHYTMTEALAVPDTIYELLETDKCVRRQKIWLMWYCHNGGNAVDACEHAGVTYRRYKTWCKELVFERNQAFVDAKNDIDAAQMDIAEMKLKEMANSKNTAAVIFFLKSRHDAYKPVTKLQQEDKRQNLKQGRDWNSEGSEKKTHALLKALDTL
jgi:hypothetical protein